MKKRKKPLESRSLLRPAHGFILGTLMVLLQSVWGVLALIGSAIMIISALAFIVSRINKKNF